jgi:hypothetical protein
VPAVDLDELINRKVADELARMNGHLERLVAEAVDAELDRLVHNLVDANLRGRADGEPGGCSSAATEEPPATRVCAHCGQAKPLAEYRPGRGRCRGCRSAQRAEEKRRHRARQEEAAPVPFAGSPSPTSHEIRATTTSPS